MLPRCGFHSSVTGTCFTACAYANRTVLSAGLSTHIFSSESWWVKYWATKLYFRFQNLALTFSFSLQTAWLFLSLKTDDAGARLINLIQRYISYGWSESWKLSPSTSLSTSFVATTSVCIIQDLGPKQKDLGTSFEDRYLIIFLPHWLCLVTNITMYAWKI